ncbi:MAG: site-specific DNA-methyltransferase [Candidatus Pacebacteria bacterium]|jgi:site-specific DNA-methyltransferase (adenine-specific)|nr:site-specific DNA-methyltransferase [Candidatus Paceibacterota bacterium]
MSFSVTKFLKGIKEINFKYSSFRKNANDHLLINGNSADVLKSFPNECIDLIFTDPPYNADLEYGSTYKDNLSWDEYYKQAKSWFKEYNRILSKTGSVYIMNYPEVNARLLPYLTDELGFKLQRWITWHYPTNIGHSKKNFTRSQRSILFLTKTNNYTFNRDKIIQPYKNENVGKIKERIKNGSRGRGAYDMLSFLDLLEMRIAEKNFNPLDVHDVNLLKNISKDRLNGKHPCQLPFELIKRFIEVSSNPGDVVLDPFAGTFSTSFVASDLKRASVGIEINPKYVSLGVKRIKNG